MKRAYISYSLMGHSAQALQLEAAQAAQAGDQVIIVHAQPAKKMGVVGALLRGCLPAVKQRPLPLDARTLASLSSTEVASCDEFVLAVPVWASMPAPFLYAIAAALPFGATVRVRLLSDSASSAGNAPKVKAALEGMGLLVADYQDIKQSQLEQA